MDIALPPTIEKFVQEQVDSGEYATPSDVVSAGLRLLFEEVTYKPMTVEEIRAAVAEGIASAEAGHTVDAVEALKRLRQEFQQHES